jgi:hypothetical protein
LVEQALQIRLRGGHRARQLGGETARHWAKQFSNAIVSPFVIMNH